jgi:cation transporter-like permease
VADVGTTPEGRPWAVAGLVLAGLGLAMFPLGGLVGVVCGGIARSKGDGTLGLLAIVAGVISFFASFWVAYLVLS